MSRIYLSSLPSWQDVAEDAARGIVGHIQCDGHAHARFTARCLRLAGSYLVPGLRPDPLNFLDFRAVTSLDDRQVRVVLVVPEPDLPGDEEWLFIERLGQRHFADVVEGRVVL